MSSSFQPLNARGSEGGSLQLASTVVSSSSAAAVASSSSSAANSSRARILQSLGSNMIKETAANFNDAAVAAASSSGKQREKEESDTSIANTVKFNRNNDSNNSNSNNSNNSSHKNNKNTSKRDKGPRDSKDDRNGGGFVAYMEGILNNNELNNKNRRHTFVLGDALKAKAIILENISSQINAGSTVSREKRKLKRDNYSMSNKKIKSLKATTACHGDVTSVTIADLNLLHALWISYSLDVVRDCRSSAQLQARFQNVELVGAYVCATDLSGILSCRSNCSSSSSSSSSSSIVGIITSVTENCYFITTITICKAKKNLDDTEVEGEELSLLKNENVVLRVKKFLKKDTALAISLPDDNMASSSSSSNHSMPSVSKDTTILRKSISKYINSTPLVPGALHTERYKSILPGISNNIINFENVVMIYGK